MSLVTLSVVNGVHRNDAHFHHVEFKCSSVQLKNLPETTRSARFIRVHDT